MVPLSKLPVGAAFTIPFDMIGCRCLYRVVKNRSLTGIATVQVDQGCKLGGKLIHMTGHTFAYHRDFYVKLAVLNGALGRIEE